MATFGMVQKETLIFIVGTYNDGRKPTIIEFYVKNVWKTSDRVIIRLNNGDKVSFKPNASSAFVKYDNYTKHIFLERAKAEEYFLSLKNE